jgi:hypothetical protein
MKPVADSKSDNNIFVIHATEQTFPWKKGDSTSIITALTPFVDHEILGDEMQQLRTLLNEVRTLFSFDIAKNKRLDPLPDKRQNRRQFNKPTAGSIRRSRAGNRKR